MIGDTIMSEQSQRSSNNLILAALPHAEYQRLIPHLKNVLLKKGHVLHKSDAPAAEVFFLEEGVASLSVSSDIGERTQLSLVGSEGVVGERAIFKEGVFIIRCAMLTEGSGVSMPPEVFHREFDRGDKLHDLVLGRIEAGISETAQTALCNQMHTIKERLIRFLLTFADRLHTEEIPITQAATAEMIGVTRSEVSRAATELREAGIIQYSRGRLTLIDRRELENKVCECYRIIKKALKEFTSSK
jgi:CRP-like cAMP-binding protein